MPIADFKRQPKGLETADGRRLHRPQARTVHDARPSTELFLPGTRPDPEARRSASAVDVDAATGLLWQDGCVGPEGHQGLLRPVRGRGRTSRPGRRRTPHWGARAAKGPGVRGGPKGTRTAVLLQRRRSPRSGGRGARRSRRRRLCPLGAAAVLRSVRVPIRSVRRPVARPASRRPDPTDRRWRRRRRRRPNRTPRAAADRRLAAQNSTIVAPSPPSPRSPGRSVLTSGWPRPSPGPRRAARRCPARG